MFKPDQPFPRARAEMGNIGVGVDNCFLKGDPMVDENKDWQGAQGSPEGFGTATAGGGSFSETGAGADASRNAVDELLDATKELRESLVKLFGAGRSAAAETVGKMRNGSGQAYGKGKERVDALYHQGKDRVDAMYRDGIDYVKEEPGKSLLIAATAGLAIGFLLRRSWR
ncbi:MAG: DUF883 family protein [Planctomycetes bacterium]|nr:DUF883 family protein [Planctomycetota bacterium]